MSNTIGRTLDAAIGAMSEDNIVAAINGVSGRLLIQPEAPPPKVLGVKVWPRVIPQYELGHLDMMTELKQSWMIILKAL